MEWHKGSSMRQVANSPRREKGGRETKRILSRLWREEAGQDLTEYVLLSVLIALALVSAMEPLGKAVSAAYSNAAANVNAT